MRTRGGEEPRGRPKEKRREERSRAAKAEMMRSGNIKDTATIRRAEGAFALLNERAASAKVNYLRDATHARIKLRDNRRKNLLRVNTLREKRGEESN